MKAIILVGGEGTRLRPLTLTTPKQMLPVVEVPMIERVVEHLVRHDVTDVVLSLGYRPDAFVAAYPDGTCRGAALSYVVEATPLDTAGAVRFAANAAGVDSTFLVLNGDVLTDLDIGALIRFHRAHGAEGTLSLTPVEDPSSFGVVTTDDQGRVLAFVEKPAPGTAPTNLINAGTYVFEPSVLERIPDGRRVNIERETFPEMVVAGALYALAHRGYWLDVGTPERYVQASMDLLQRFVSEGGSDVFMGPGVRIAAGATVKQSVLGADVLIGDETTVVGSVLLRGAQVGTAAEVRDSIVGPEAVIGPGAIVTGWSIVGAGSVVDAGARLTGERV